MELNTSDYKKVVSYARRRTLSWQDAEDLAHEAFIKALDKGDTVLSHVFTYVHDKAYSAAEKRTSRAPLQQRADQQMEPFEPSETIEEQILAAERREMVTDFLVTCMDEAPPAQQHVIRSLAFQKPEPRAYLIKVLGLSKPLATYHYNQAFAHLTSYLKQTGAVA